MKRYEEHGVVSFKDKPRPIGRPKLKKKLGSSLKQP